MAQTEYVVETHGLTKRFGDGTVVRNVDLQVPRGVAFGYLGPNGAGKTTLIPMLLDLTRPNGGTMPLRGLPVPARRAEALSRVGAIVDEPRFHRHLTGIASSPRLADARRLRASPTRSSASGWRSAQTIA
jgi:ABC-2 type transport system ATP-binding protein